MLTFSKFSRKLGSGYIDHLLLKALQENDEKALNHLFEQEYNRLFRYGIRLRDDNPMVQECIQDVFQDLWHYRQKIDAIESFEAYLKTSLKRRIFKAIEKKEKTKFASEAELETKPLSVESYEEILIEQQSNAQIKQQLAQLLEQLSPRQKEIVQLKYFEELSYPQISEQTGLQIDTVYKILHEAIKKLKGLIG